MEDQKHISGPWITNYIGRNFLIQTREGRTISTVFAHDQEEANARRIVACVNACEGLETENLENAGLLRDGLESVQGRIKELKAENARLREAMKGTMEWIDRWEPQFTYTLEWVEQESKNRALIAQK